MTRSASWLRRLTITCSVAAMVATTATAPACADASQVVPGSGTGGTASSQIPPTSPSTTDDVLNELNVHLKKDLTKIDDQQLKEMKSTDFSKMSAHESASAYADMQNKYQNMREIVQLAFDAEKRRLNRTKSKVYNDQWDSVDSINAKAKEFAEIVSRGKGGVSSEDDGLKVGLAIVGGIAALLIVHAAQEHAEYLKMTPEQKAEYDHAKARERKLIEDSQKSRCENNHTSDLGETWAEAEFNCRY